jgi:hypothetical protein
MSSIVTALGDALFATSALRASARSTSLLALGGFGLVGAAAFVSNLFNDISICLFGLTDSVFIWWLCSVIGTLRFAGMSQLIPLHTFLSGFAGDVGIPMIGAAFFLFSGKISPGKFKPHDTSLILIAGLIIGALVSTFYLPLAQQELYRTISPRASSAPFYDI